MNPAAVSSCTGIEPRPRSISPMWCHVGTVAPFGVPGPNMVVRLPDAAPH